VRYIRYERIGVRIDLAASIRAGRRWKKSSGRLTEEIYSSPAKSQYQLSRQLGDIFESSTLNRAQDQDRKISPRWTSEKLALKYELPQKDHRLSRDRQN